MNANEMLKLDTWLAKHVTKKKIHLVQDGGCYIQYEPMPGNRYLNKYSPTTDPTAAMEVLRVCMTKQSVNMLFSKSKNEWWVEGFTADTLELAICKLAKKIFSK